MKKIFVIIAIEAIAMSCVITKYTTNDGYYTSNGTGVSVDRDISYDLALTNALNKVNINNSVSVNGNTVREYDSKSASKGKDVENVRYGELVITKSKMDAYGIKVTKEKYSKSREEGKEKYKCYVEIAIPKENVE